MTHHRQSVEVRDCFEMTARYCFRLTATTVLEGQHRAEHCHNGEQRNRERQHGPPLTNAADRLHAKISGHPHEIGNRIRLHLLEDAMPMDLGRLLGYPEVEADLLVQLPAD